MHEDSKPHGSATIPSSDRGYDAALAALAQLLNVEKLRPAIVDAKQVFTLARMEALLQALGNPHHSLTVVHVAGSKGKGSVCEMTAAALGGCGCSVGLYTSPHLVDIRERIRVDGVLIARERFAILAFRVLEAARTLEAQYGSVTHFEALTAMAFVCFAEDAVDVAVVEVGLGGRLDATNVVRPAVTAITAIQSEHVQFLGPTLADIARHKAGIMKPGVPAITLQQDPAILTILAEEAAQAKTLLHVVGGSSVSGIANTKPLDFAYRFEAGPRKGAVAKPTPAPKSGGLGGVSGGGVGPSFCISMQLEHGAFEHVPVPLLGEHQAWNAGIVLGIVDALRGKGMALPETRILDGLATCPRAGRLELLLREPKVYADGAHNPESIAGLVKALGAHTRYDSLVVVFGCASDKDVAGMLTAIGMGADKIVFTKSASTASQRAMEPKDLARKYAELTSKNAQIAPTVKEAINLAARAMGRGDVMLVTGSFLVAGEAKRLIHEKLGSHAQPATSAIDPKPLPKGSHAGRA